jgi:hypothetical protein
LSLTKRDTPNLLSTQEIIKARGNASRATKIPVLQKIAYTTGSVRSCTGETKSSVSALVTLSWVTKTGGFHMVPVQYQNNEIGYIEDFKHKLQQLELQWAKEIEAAIYTKMDAVKSTTFTAQNAPFEFIGNVIQVPAKSQSTYLSKLYASLYQDDFNSPFNIAASPGLMPINNYFAAQGGQNAVNTLFQFGDYSFDYSNRVTPSGGADATFFVMPTGSIGILDWIDPDSRAGTRISEGNYWDKFDLPMLGMQCGLHYQMACGDNSTETGAGNEASATENFNFSFDYCLVSPYISSGASPIFKVDMLTL